MPLEAVPNFSEGRERATIEAIAAALAAHAELLDIHSDVDHNRSVYTLVGDADALIAALLTGITAAKTLIDLREHEGAHPRIGAADVVPIVPMRPEDTERARAAAEELARRIGGELELPVFLYGGLAPGRGPAFFRRGGPEELQRRIDARELTPDYGPRRLDPRAGGVIVGTRRPLIAFNVNLRIRSPHLQRASPATSAPSRTRRMQAHRAPMRRRSRALSGGARGARARCRRRRRPPRTRLRRAKSWPRRGRASSARAAERRRSTSRTRSSLRRRPPQRRSPAQGEVEVPRTPRGCAVAARGAPRRARAPVRAAARRRRTMPRSTRRTLRAARPPGPQPQRPSLRPERPTSSPARARSPSERFSGRRAWGGVHRTRARNTSWPTRARRPRPPAPRATVRAPAPRR